MMCAAPSAVCAGVRGEVFLRCSIGGVCGGAVLVLQCYNVFFVVCWAALSGRPVGATQAW